MKAFSVLGVVVVAASAAGAARGEESKMLEGTVGPGFDIALTDPISGRRVDRLAPGAYTIVVHDRSEIHNFKLANKPDGKRVNIDSGVEFVGDKTFAVDLQPGEYAYACSPHWQTMNGGFTVVRPAAVAPTTIVAVRLPASRLPRAGRIFSLRGLRAELSTGERVRPDAVSGTAVIAGKRAARAGPLAWRIPRAARGKTLVLVLHISYGSARTTKALRLRIR